MQFATLSVEYAWLVSFVRNTSDGLNFFCDVPHKKVSDLGGKIVVS